MSKGTAAAKCSVPLGNILARRPVSQVGCAAREQNRRIKWWTGNPLVKKAVGYREGNRWDREGGAAKVSSIVPGIRFWLGEAGARPRQFLQRIPLPQRHEFCLDGNAARHFHSQQRFERFQLPRL